MEHGKMWGNSNELHIVLEGKTLGQRHRHLNTLVQRASDDVLAPENLTDLHSKTQLELLFLAKVADCKRNPQIICELLKSENVIVLHTALHAKWLFKATTHKDYSNVSYFVTNVFPFVSHHAICRIVANFGAYIKSELVADEFFKTIKDLYGWKLALKLLPKCTLDCIHSQIKNVSKEIPCGILYKIYLKQKQPVVDYLNYYLSSVFSPNENKKSNNFSFVDYDKILKKIALDMPDAFIEIIKKYPHASKGKDIAGKRTTKNLLSTSSTDVVKYARQLQYSIKNKTVINSLKGKNRDGYLYNCLPDRYDDFMYCLVLNHFKNKKKILSLLKIHPMKYNGASLLEREDFLSMNLLKHIPANIRTSWAQNKLKSSTDTKLRKIYLKYLQPELAVPLLCQNIQRLEDTFDTFQEIADCYVIHNEEEGLVRTIKQVVQILQQNPSTGERCIKFLDHIKKSYNVYTVTDTLWASITRFIESLAYSSQLSPELKFLLIPFICDQICYHVSHGGSFENIVYKLLVTYKFDIWMPYVLDIVMSLKEPQHKLHFLRTFVTNLRVLMVDGCKEFDIWKKTLFIIQVYNEIKKFIGVSFTENEWLIEIICKYVPIWQAVQTKQLMVEINKDYKGRKLFYINIYKYSTDISILYWLLENDPSVIINDFSKFCTFFTHDIIGNDQIQKGSQPRVQYNPVIFTRWTTGAWNDFELPKQSFESNLKLNKNFRKKSVIINKLQSYFLSVIKPVIEKFLNDNKSNPIKSPQQAFEMIFLTLLAMPGDNKNFIEASIPKKRNVANTKFYQTVTKFLKIINPPLTYGMLMKYFDYGSFNLVESSIFSIAFKKSLKDTRTFIQDLIKETVAMKKLAIHLAYLVCPKKELLSLYTEIWNKNINTQLKIILFKKTFKLLINEDKEQYCHEIWQTLKYFIGCFIDIDVKLLNYIKDTNKISKHQIMFTDYCETTWKVLKELENKYINVDNLKTTLIKCIRMNVNNLNELFLENYIADYWNHIETVDFHGANEMFPFLIAYLMKARDKSTQTSCLIYIAKKYTKCVSQFWDLQVNGVHVFRDIIYRYVTTLIKESIQNISDYTLLNISACSTMLGPTSLIAQKNDDIVILLHVLVDLAKSYTAFYYRSERKHYFKEQCEIFGYSSALNKQYGLHILSTLGELEKKFGSHYISSLVQALQLMISFIIENKSEEVQQDFTMSLLDGLKLMEQNDETFALFVTLLPDRLYKGNKYTNEYNTIKSRLNSIIAI